MEKDKYIIMKWYKGHFGYKESYSLMCWNSVYKKYTDVHFALRLQFIYDYCLLHNIKGYKNFSITER